MVKLELDPREHAVFGMRLYEPNYYGIKWSVQVPVSHLEMNPSLLNPKDRDAEKATYKWMKATLNVKKLIWPYPDEQLQWLLDTVDGLGGTALESLKRTEEQWHETRYSNCFAVFSLTVFSYEKLLDTSCCNYGSLIPDSYQTLHLTTKAPCNGQKLQTVNLAFFGRLLVTMNKVKPIPGFQSPSCEFSDAFHFFHT